MVYEDRLQFQGELEPIIADVARGLGLGHVVSISPISVGFEDYNTKIVTDSGAYVFKIFSKKRTHEEVERCADIIDQVCKAGIRHPAVHRTTEGAVLFKHSSGLQVVAMDYVDGQSFYEKGTPPNDEELRKIVQEAVKINKLDLQPPYLFDSWAIPNMGRMFERTREYLSDEGRRLVETAFERYNNIPLDMLPKAFVHGDLIKTNILVDTKDDVYVIDFSVANTYPRIQEIAVMAANLMFDEKHGITAPLRERVDKLVAMYEAAGGDLTDIEKQYVFDYALPGCAMEYMGSVNERIATGETDEIMYWEKLGFEGLKEALAETGHDAPDTIGTT